MAYFGSCALVFLLTFFIGRKVFRLRGDESTVFGMSAIFSNNVQLGIPLAISLLGENCVPSIAFIVSLNVFLLWVAVTVGVELSRSREASVLGTCFEGLWRTIKNPVIIGILLGLLTSAAGMNLPEPLEKSLGLLSASATPVALFSVGTGLSRYKLSSHFRLTGALHTADHGFPFVSLIRNYRNRAAGGLPIGEPSGRRERLYHGAGIRSDRGAGCQRFAAHDLSFDAHGSAYDLSV